MNSISVNVIEDRLEALQEGKVSLDHGSHQSYEDGHCAMEVVAWLAGEGITDAPECASPVLRRFTIDLNDRWDQAQRQKLVPLLPRMVGTGGDGKDEIRSYMALDWLVRTFTPAWLDLAGLSVEAQELRDLRRIVDLVAAKDAGAKVRQAAGKAQEKRAAVWAAAWAAAGAAVRAAVWAAAWAAAGAAAGAAAWAAAWAAAGDAAGAATKIVLRPTVEQLQSDALALLDRMISPPADFLTSGEEVRG